jgi:AcrR family transcriptional regulator
LVPFDRIQLSQEILVAAIGEGWPEDEVDAAVEMLVSGEGRFPSGARKLPSELVKAVQRERLILAMLKAAAELGYRETNVQDVIDRAGVSRPTFYEHFANKEDCFLAAFDVSAQRLREKLEAAAEKGGDVWRDRIRYALEALLQFASTEPETARTLIVEARAGSAKAVLRRVEMLDRFADCLETQARELLPYSASTSALTASGVVGGVESLLYSRLCKGEHAELEALLPSLMYFVVLPYEGHEAAGEELALDG